MHYYHFSLVLTTINLFSNPLHFYYFIHGKLLISAYDSWNFAFMMKFILVY